jgi:hypothetical protein
LPVADLRLPPARAATHSATTRAMATTATTRATTIAAAT